MSNIVVDTLTLINGTSDAMIGDIYGAFAVLKPFVRNMIVISVMLFGGSLMMGWIVYPVKKLAQYLFTVLIVYVMAFNWGYFSIFFYSFITDSPDALGKLIIDSVAIPGVADSDGVAEVIGELYSTGAIATGKIFANAGFGIINYILGALVFLSVLFVTGYVVALIAIAKIGMTLVLSLAPIFFIFLLFEPTKQMFSSWLQQTFNFAFISILTYIVVAFLIVLLGRAIILIPEEDVTFGHIAPLCFVSLITIIVLSQIPGIASGLAGGAQLSAMGAGAAAYRGAKNGFSNTGKGIEKTRRGVQKTKEYIQNRRSSQIGRSK